MLVGKWTKPKSDDEIIAFLFNGTVEDFECPHCAKQAECEPNIETIKCECGEEYYSPIYDPKIGL